jgi:protein-export membrane protein, SecD/SecF family/protein-export membrane protein SecD
MNLTSQRFILFSFGFWVLLAAVCIFLLYPIREKLRFGIDLVGGTYINLEVQTDKAVEAELAEKIQGLSDKLRKANKVLPISKEVKDETLILNFDNLDALQGVASYVTLSEPQLKQSVEGTTLKLRFEDKFAKRIKENAVRSDIEVLHSRLNKLNVEETPVTKQGERNILVELPGIDDLQKAKAMIGKVAKLEFKLVERSGGSREDILYELEGEDLPPDKEILHGKEGQYYLLSKYTDLTGKLLKEAKAGLGGHTGVEPIVHLQFNESGAEKFYELTRKNYGKQLSIVLDGEVLLAPTIQGALRGSCEITNMGSTDACKELAILLKSGAFAAPVTFEEERQIGPSLGSELIHKGLMSCLIGLLLLFVFSVFFYKLSGLLSFIALLYNLLLILVGMHWLGATMTMPGIAGLVLTVGMAIDCSILIYEHIREELAAGITVKKAVNNGFAGALVVILDSNITHLITAIVLYKFGTGPIKGFAVTWMLGTIATLITGLTVLRSMFNFILEFFDVQKLSI